MKAAASRSLIALLVLTAAGAGFVAGHAVGRRDTDAPQKKAAPPLVPPDLAAAKPAADGKAGKAPRARRRPVSELIAELASPDQKKRLAACQALARRKDPSARKPLLEVLHGDKDTHVRYQSAMALAALGAPVVDDLIAALGSKNPDVRYKAGNALEKVRPAAAALKGLKSALGAKSAEVRLHAVFLVSKIGTRESVPLLAGALSDADATVIKKAEAALKRAARRHRAEVQAAAKDPKLPAAARARLEAILAAAGKPAPKKEPAKKPEETKAKAPEVKG